MPSISVDKQDEDEDEDDVTIPLYEDPIFDSVPLDERLSKGIGHFFELVL